MTWIDYKKAYDIVSQSCLKMYKLYDNVKKFIIEAMKIWKMELTSEGKTLTEVEIQNCIFHEDALSLLLISRVMMPLNHLLKKFTGG